MDHTHEVSDRQWVERIAALAADDTAGATIAVAESLTAGRISAALGQGEGHPDVVVASATTLALPELAKALEPESGPAHDASEQGYVGA